MVTSSAAVSPRPRVVGAREQEILDATLEVLVEVGYDRLTMDAVAAVAHASKATLYRRWDGKADLVVDALAAHKRGLTGVVPDTGTLRGDLIASFCGSGGLSETMSSTFASVITALGHDPDFAAGFRAKVIAPRMAVTRALFERAVTRGEIRADLDLDLLAPAVAGIVLHRFYVLGEPPEATTITRVIDQIILPACLSTT